jgi:hypothetical protein
MTIRLPIALFLLLLAVPSFAQKGLAPSSIFWRGDVERFVSDLHRNLHQVSNKEVSLEIRTEIEAQVDELKKKGFTTQGASYTALLHMDTGSGRNEKYLVTTEYVKSPGEISEESNVTAIIITRSTDANGPVYVVNKVLSPKDSAADLFDPR